MSRGLRAANDIDCGTVGDKDTVKLRAAGSSSSIQGLEGRSPIGTGVPQKACTVPWENKGACGTSVDRSPPVGQPARVTSIDQTTSVVGRDETSTRNGARPFRVGARHASASEASHHKEVSDRCDGPRLQSFVPTKHLPLSQEECGEGAAGCLQLSLIHI